MKRWIVVLIFVAVTGCSGGGGGGGSDTNNNTDPLFNPDPFAHDAILRAHSETLPDCQNPQCPTASQAILQVHPTETRLGCIWNCVLGQVGLEQDFFSIQVHFVQPASGGCFEVGFSSAVSLDAGAQADLCQAPPTPPAAQVANGS